MIPQVALKPELGWKVDEETLQFHWENNMEFFGVRLILMWEEETEARSIEMKAGFTPGPVQ